MMIKQLVLIGLIVAANVTCWGMDSELSSKYEEPDSNDEISKFTGYWLTVKNGSLEKAESDAGSYSDLENEHLEFTLNLHLRKNDLVKIKKYLEQIEQISEDRIFEPMYYDMRNNMNWWTDEEWENAKRKCEEYAYHFLSDKNTPGASSHLHGSEHDYFRDETVNQSDDELELRHCHIADLVNQSDCKAKAPDNSSDSTRSYVSNHKDLAIDKYAKRFKSDRRR